LQRHHLSINGAAHTREIHTFYRRNNQPLYRLRERSIVENGTTGSLIDQYQQILASRRERFSSDAVFGGRKYQFEKALLEKIGHVRDPERANALQSMYRELATFVPQSDYDLISGCQRRAATDPAVKRVLDLIEAGDHDAVQKELDALGTPELVRYYALYRRILLEGEARRKQAASVFELNADS
jgi:hypothetical protein